MAQIVTDADILAQLNAPARAPVPSTPKIMGDTEAEQSGIYEQTKRFRPVTDPAVLQQLNAGGTRPQITVNPEPQASFAQRFNMPTPSADSGLQSGLQRRAIEATRGPAVGPIPQMAQEFANVLGAASQGTVPDIMQHGGQFISDQVLQDDAGNIQYRDPQTGQVKNTDQRTEVALRDPVDQRVKIFRRTADTEEMPVTGAARVLAPGLATGAVTARAMLPAFPKGGIRASEMMREAKPYYQSFQQEASQLQATPDMAATLAGRIRGALDQANFTDELAKPVYSATAILEKGKPITLDELQRVKRVIGKSFNSPDKNIRDAAAVATAEVQRIIADVSPTAARSLQTGDQIHATALAMQDLQRKGEIAGLRTGRAGYGGNAVNAMRQVLSPIVQRAIEGRKTLFKPPEIAAMRDIVEGTGATNAFRQVGVLSPSKGIIQLGAAGASGGAAAMAAGGPVGAAVGIAIPALGMAANKIATMMTGKQLDRLRELVSKRSPAYAEAVRKAADRWDRTQMEFANKPTPNTLAAYVSASRAFSAGLTRDGIAISSGDLLRAISGPVKGAAEGDHQPVPGIENQ